jgi:hypothetical protein
MITQIRAALAVALTALFVVPALLSTNVSRADRPTCPCFTDNDAYNYSMADPTICDTAPQPNKPDAIWSSVGIHALLTDDPDFLSGDYTYKLQAELYYAGNSGCGFIDKNGPSGIILDDLTPNQVTTCILTIANACRNAGF